MSLIKQGLVYYFDGVQCDAVNVIDVTTTPISLRVESEGEQGLTTMLFDPEFTNNEFVYFYHATVNNEGNALTRMTLSLTGGLARATPRPSLFSNS